MKIAALVSGGKDSIYAMYKAMKKHEVAVIVSFVSKNEESYMFHTPNMEHIEIFEKALGIPVQYFKINGNKEFEVNEMKAALSWIKREYKIEGIVTGAVQSQYQKERVDKVCEELNLKSIAPLWQVNHEKYLKEFMRDGFKAIIVGVFAEGLTKEWLGKEINQKTIKELMSLKEKYMVSPIGEGGEYESFTYDGPIFKKRIKIESSEIIWEKNSGILKIKKLSLAKK